MQRLRVHHLAVVGAIAVVWVMIGPRRSHSVLIFPAAPAWASAAASPVRDPIKSERPPLSDAASESVRERRLLADVAALADEFARLRALPDDIERFRRASDIENEFAALLDPETAALLIQRMPAGFADTHFGALALIKWAAADRVVAATWMAAHPATSATAGEALARGWFAQDQATLTAHLDQLPASPWKTQLALTAGEDAFLTHDPQAVLRLLERADAADARRTQLTEWNLTAWAKDDTEAAAAWAAREPQAARREKLLAAVAIGQANVHPVAASTRLLRTVVEPEALIPAVHALARIWAARDPEAAALWVDQLPKGPLREKADEGLLAIIAPAS